MLTRRMFSRLPLFVALIFCIHQAFALDQQVGRKIDSYVRPYVRSGNFSGAVLVRRNGRTVFQRAYGFADRDRRIRNTPDTQFHVASVSMQFTAAAVLRLVDKGVLTLDTHVGDFVHDIPGAEKITIRDLLMQRSGLPDINELPEYADILQHHQTPASLVAKIEGRPLLFEPGSKFLHEEHSAYNLLASIVEKKTGLPFASAVRDLVFRPAGLPRSGVDDDNGTTANSMARGYEPVGTSGVKNATAIHWSAKGGNASVYTTAAEEAKFAEVELAGSLLSATSRKEVLDTTARVGYGWFRGLQKRLNETAYYMNGRSPGFASFVLYVPREKMTVVVLSNIYSSATTTIGYDIAALVLGLPYTPFQPMSPPPDPKELKASAATFQFGADFYQPNAKIELVANGAEVTLHWPSGNISSLIPLARDRFVDRSYWEEVRIERDASGRPAALLYGSFRGRAESR